MKVFRVFTSIFSGEFIFPNQDRYKGEYAINENGLIERQGKGTHTTNDGIVYTGFWNKDKMNGQGRITFPSGATYEGEFLNNRYHGNGSYTWPNGCTYKGSFEDSKLQGEGSFCDTHDQIWSGTFHGKAAPGLKFKLNL